MPWTSPKSQTVHKFGCTLESLRVLLRKQNCSEPASIRSSGGGARESAFLKTCPGDSNTQPMANSQDNSDPSVGRWSELGGLGLRFRSASSSPSAARGRSTGARPAGVQKIAAENARTELGGSPRAASGRAVRPLQWEATGGTRSRVVSPDWLFGQRAHQELQQRQVEGPGQSLRPLALAWRRPPPRRLQAPTGHGRPRRACPPQG